MNGQNLPSEDIIFSKVETLMTRLNQNQKLQELAAANGLDAKNAVHLTKETMDNIAVSVVALLLAKQDGDPDYQALVRAGMNHRKIKTELINKYKNQANQLLDRYRNERDKQAFET